MTLNSVSMIIAPNLFLVGASPPAGSASARRPPKRIKQLLEVSTAAGISCVVRLVMCYQDLLWQVRHLAINWLFVVIRPVFQISGFLDFHAETSEYCCLQLCFAKAFCLF